jgi:hypothetical protein
MSLYHVQKAIYEVNRSPSAVAQYKTDPAAFCASYDLTPQERAAFVKPDVGMLYVLGVNGQLLMHFAAANGYEWNAYIDAMLQGIVMHGPVREGLYAMTGATT